MYFSAEEIRYYNRQIILSDFGAEGQHKLKSATVLVVGTGGLGSPCLYYLAGAGVGHIDIVDFDTVSTSNLHRQILFDINQKDQPKSTAAAQKMTALNPHITVGVLDIKADSRYLALLIEDYDVVVDCTDLLDTKLMLNDLCLAAGRPLCFAGVLGFECQLKTVIPGQNACLRCIFGNDAGAQGLPSCSEAGVIGAVAGTAGTMLANHAIRLLTQDRQHIDDVLTMYDAYTGTIMTLTCQPDENCRCRHLGG